MRSTQRKCTFFISVCLLCVLIPKLGVGAVQDPNTEGIKHFSYSGIKVMQDYKIGDNADLLNYKLHKHVDVYSSMPHNSIDLDLRWSNDAARDMCRDRNYCSNRAMNEEAMRSQVFRNNRVDRMEDKLNPDLELQFSIPFTKK